MSLVHISFVPENKHQDNAIYNVLSSDFSDREESIGKISLDYQSNSFTYEASDKLKKQFCPPEYFSKFNGNIEAVSKYCEGSGFVCMAWSARIYRWAQNELKSRSQFINE